MRVITGILAVAALILSGCSEAAEPTTLPAQPSPASPSALPLATPAASTAAASPTADEGAELALEEYFRSANMVAKGAAIDGHELLYSDSCEACVSATADFAAAQQEGLRADGDRFARWSIDTQNESDKLVLATSVIDFDAVDLIDGDGSVADSVPAWSEATFAWTLRKQPDGSWLIVQGQLLQ